MAKLRTLSQVLPNANRLNTVERRRQRQDVKHDNDLLARCERAWENLRRVREIRERTMRYSYGDQWGDLIKYKDETMTEREYIKKKGNIPLSNNIMVSILNSTVGLYAKQGTEPVCFARTRNAQWLSDMMSATMQCNWQNTKMEDLLKHTFEEFLNSGIAIARESWEEHDEIPDSWTSAINPIYAFWEGGSDPRHLDLNLIGVLHDISKEDLYTQFTPYGWTIEDLDNLYYTDTYDQDDGLQTNEVNDLSNVNFRIPSRKNLCRVIEVWTKEVKPRYQCWDKSATNESDAYFRLEEKDIDYVLNENKKRKKMYDSVGIEEDERIYIEYKHIVDSYWYYTYLTPDGTILCSGETPYDYHSHPFSIKLYPFVNGEIHPFMANIIDQQRYINRLIVMNDFAIRTSAKGITIVPTNVIPDNMSPRQFAEQFTAYDGLVFYTPSTRTPQVRPEVITSNAVNIGTNELLQIELNLIRDISNVSGALQGKTPSSGTAASRYAMEAQNATTSLYSVLKDFSDFTECIADKKCETIKQFYPDGRMIFNKDFTQSEEYDALAASDVKFKIAIKESAATATYQTKVNEQLDKLLEAGQITILEYLENVNAPFADSLLQSVQSRMAQQAQIQNMQAPQGQVPGADQQAVQNAQNLLSA